MNPASGFLALPPARRDLIIEQAAMRLAVHPVILEKDFWVCWLLGVIFSEPTVAPHIVFKGGTSLSKVFGVIERFSEDIDLSVSPAFVGADAEEFERITSRTGRDRAMTRMQAMCVDKTRDVIAPTIEREVRHRLGDPGHPWLSFELETAQTPILRFLYPTTRRDGFVYVQRSVKLELGTLTDQEPVARHPIRPWVADVFPAAFDDWQCEVTALGVGRTFWEKATILHAEHHRPSDQPMPERYARHYSDTARLIGWKEGPALLADKAQCDRVVAWKDKVFARSWARYDLAHHGTFRLAPPPPRLAALAQDYATMRPMFLGEPPSFEDMMRQLADAEQAINRL